MDTGHYGTATGSEGSRRAGAQCALLASASSQSLLMSSALRATRPGWHDVTLVKDAIGRRSWDEMKATLEVNAPNYARAMLSTDDLLTAFQNINA